jgi:hypothetical protein
MKEGPAVEGQMVEGQMVAGSIVKGPLVEGPMTGVGQRQGDNDRRTNSEETNGICTEIFTGSSLTLLCLGGNSTARR